MSIAEQTLAVQLDQAGIPFEREYVFVPDEWAREHGFLSEKRRLPRKWRADFAIEGAYNEADHIDRLLVEIDGGGYVSGRHSRGAGMEKDAEKQSAAAILGYRVIRATPKQVEDGRCLSWIRQALGLEEQAA